MTTTPAAKLRSSSYWSTRLLDWLVFRSNWQMLLISTGTAFLTLATFYAILKISYVLGFSPAVANILGWLLVILLLGILFYGFLSAMLRLIRHRILMYTTGPDALRKISPLDLEHLTAAVYEAQGCRIKKRGVPGQPDGGIDLEILRNGKHGIIQCKRWTHENISVDKIQQLYGALSEKKADFAIFVTTSDFTEPAEKYAQGKPIELVNFGHLWEMILEARLDDEVQQRASRAASLIELKNRQPLRCPQCGDLLVLRRSRHGPFLGCRSYFTTACDTLIPVKEAQSRSAGNTRQRA